ncbi:MULTISPECIES: tetratricopeptide repeat protein [Nitrospirillum]|uniref:Tetratricopeptide repeat protein n=1 Tax=Nitrospirillum amazonense TaxID=28077 RepID=A0A560FUL2_9PROT|nr:tetratricopeptide repeat protein [Nitrospirillum amazonense]MEC4592617.1 tetratricopeptide repeat protein [Nitrospirillum amazonense]TWB25326.1 tetratricopeptide repeat protein [Nitrospirillum amazonense]
MASVTEALSAAYEHHVAGRLDAAVTLYGRIIDAEPRNHGALHLLGLARIQLGDLDGATESMMLAAAIVPDNPTYRSNLGTALKAQGRFDLAEEAYRQALAIDPGHVDAMANLGGVLHATGRLAAAIACLERALALAPDHAVTLINLGVALTDRGQLPRALGLLRRAVEVTAPAPGQPLGERGGEARWDLALALLMAGDYAAGWPQFEARRGRAGHVLARPHGLEWDGADPAGRTILVHSEQGRGDSLQFARFIAPLASRGARVVLACQPELARLLATAPGVAQVVSTADPTLPAYDVFCPLLSLPGRLGLTSAAELATAGPYLAPDPAQAATLRARVNGVAAGRRAVGLCWAGAPGNPVDARRSLDPALLAPLARFHDRVAFVSLQKGGPAVPAALPLIDWTAELADYADTAALVANLDLVITVDTSVAHLAGALGRPVWLLNRYDGCWRWQKGRVDSPWYPSLVQLRQEEMGDWRAPLSRLTARLGAWLAAPPP